MYLPPSTGGILWLILSLPSMELAQTISFKLQGEGSTRSWVYVNFFGDTFLEFYACFRSPNSQSCSVAVTRDSKAPANVSELQVVSTHKATDQEPNQAYSRYFTCALSQDLQQVLCRRLPVFSPCHPNNVPFQDLQLEGGQCVGLVWSVVGEQLVNGSQDIPVCPLICDHDEIQGSFDNDQHEDEHRPDSAELHQNDNNDKRSAWRDDHDKTRHWGHLRRYDNEFSDTKSHIIIAVVCSIGLTAALLIAAGLFHRKFARMRTPPAAKEDVKIPATQPSKVLSDSRNNKPNNLLNTSFVLDLSRLNGSTCDVTIDGLPP